MGDNQLEVHYNVLDNHCSLTCIQTTLDPSMVVLSITNRYIRRHGSDVYLGMSPVQNGGSYLMY